MMNDSVAAKFVFKSKHIEVEFEGRADFVTAQIQHMKSAFFRTDAPPIVVAPAAVANAPAAVANGPTAMANAPTAVANAPAAITPAAEVSLDTFYKRAKSRIGRGAIQETLLIFAYFLREHRNKDEFGVDQLKACFSVVGVHPPKSLTNTLGLMRRVNKFFHSGTRRGTYALTEKGSTYVKKLVGG